VEDLAQVILRTEVGHHILRKSPVGFAEEIEWNNHQKSCKKRNDDLY